LEPSVFSDLRGDLAHEELAIARRAGGAAASKGWAIGSLLFFVAVTLLAIVFPDAKILDQLTRILGFWRLLRWYFANARSQQCYIEEKFGKDYPRKGWAKPLLVALVVTIGFIVVVGVLAVVIDGPSTA